MITIQVKNIATIQKAFRKAPAKMATGIRKGLVSAGIHMSKKTREHITMGTEMWKPPIDKGAMRRGIQVAEKKAYEVVIRPSSRTPYALYVHEGTRKMKKRPFFDITAKRERKNLEKFFQKELDKIAKDIIK